MAIKKEFVIEDIEAAILEIQQPRSRFQLEQFVIGSHPTNEMKYHQVCLELQDMLYKYKIAVISIRKLEIKIARLKATNDELDALEAEEQQLTLEQLKITMLGAEREIAHLVDIWTSFETKYTREEIELSQADYWKQRLTINAKAMAFGQGTINPAHIEAMEQAGVLDDYVKEVEAANELRNLEA